MMDVMRDGGNPFLRRVCRTVLSGVLRQGVGENRVCSLYFLGPTSYFFLNHFPQFEGWFSWYHALTEADQSKPQVSLYLLTPLNSYKHP